MKRVNIEMVVGFFLIFGLMAFAFLAVKLGGIGNLDANHYILKARFDSSSGLKEGASVEMAGVEVGKVKNIRFDPEYFESVVEVSIPNEVQLTDDSIASVRSTGIIGGKFIKISPGGSPDFLKPGDTITETESSVSLEELISKYIFESQSSKE
jgi:phospholipid/cholesterol/gamma-HCH transport system substrate-binding protein